MHVNGVPGTVGLHRLENSILHLDDIHRAGFRAQGTAGASISCAECGIRLLEPINPGFGELKAGKWTGLNTNPTGDASRVVNDRDR